MRNRDSPRSRLEMLVGTIQEHARSGHMKQFLMTISALRSYSNP